MLVLNQSGLNKIMEKGQRALANAYVYVLSHEVELEGGNDNFVSLFPSKEEIEAVVNGDIDKKTFLKEYKKSLKSYQNKFLLYTIARSFNEKKYMPIFVCSDAEYELGYMKVLEKVLKKSYGMKAIKVKDYLKAVKIVSKEIKKNKIKKSKRDKAMEKGLRDFVKDNCQINIKGLEKLEAADQEFAIDRVALLINQSDNAMEEIGKKAIAQSIESFGKTKKGKKLIKTYIDELDLSKKRDRWSKKDMINLVLAIYNDIHEIEDDN